MSEKPKSYWIDPPRGYPEKRPLNKTDAIYLGAEVALVLLGISFLPDPKSGIALFSLLVELQRRASKNLKIH